MAQIFISHSAKDKEGVDFFSRVFSGTNVKALFEEYEKLTGQPINNGKIRADIDNSNSIFVLLDETTEKQMHTRDWVVSEYAYGSHSNRDVWIFEKIKDFGKISIVTPYLKHYVLYDDWYPYVRAIVESYDNSNVINTILATAAITAVVTDEENKLGKVLLASGAAAVLTHKTPRPSGVDVKCIYCNSIYTIHVPDKQLFRCPVCNRTLQLIDEC